MGVLGLAVFGFGNPIPLVIDKDRPIKSLGSMSHDEIFKAFNMYIKRYKSSIFGGESCDI